MVFTLDIYVKLGLGIKWSQLILQTTLARNMDLFVPLILSHLQLFKSKTSVLGRLLRKNMGLIASQLANRICWSAEQSCPTSSLINTSTTH